MEQPDITRDPLEDVKARWIFWGQIRYTITRIFRQMHSWNSFRKVWSFREGGLRVIIADIPAPKTATYATGAGQLIGASLLLPTLHSLYAFNAKNFLIEPSSRAWEERNYEHCNLILLGGPVTNHVTRQVLDETQTELAAKLTWKFRDHKLYNQTLVPKGITEEYEAVVDENGLQRDFGLVVKAVSPFDPKRLIYILAGCRSFGTYAAVSILTSANSVRRIARYSGSGCFEGIVQVDMSGNPFPDSIEIIKWKSLSS